ncbi:MAG TPA: DUF4363 family protein [Desulfobacteria bacterium]|nr:DUF4363 family protein [Desulfobacteria bacterium]
MRTITVTLLGFALLVGISLGANSYLNSSAQHLSRYLANTEKSIQADKWSSATNDLNKMQIAWRDTKYWWSILLDHQEIDNIEISLNRLDEYIKTKGMSLSLGELSALQMLIEHISDKETPSLRNIL